MDRKIREKNKQLEEKVDEICKDVNLNEKMEISPLTHDIVFTNLRGSQVQMDILFMVLAEIGNEDDCDAENRCYQITAEQLMKMKHYSNLRSTRKIMKDNVLGYEEKHNKITQMDVTVRDNARDIVEVYNWFTYAGYDNGTLKLRLSPEIKRKLIQIKHNNEYKIFASLQYLLPMGSRYSKQIYLMCKNYISSGIMYAMDFNDFCKSLGIPETYSLKKIETLILDKSKDEINSISDIIIDYSIEKKAVTGGNQAKSISFLIKYKNKPAKNKKSEIPANSTTERYDKKKPVKSNNKFTNYPQRDSDEIFSGYDSQLIILNN